MKPRGMQAIHQPVQMTLGQDGKSSAEQKEALQKTLVDDQGKERRRD